MVFLDITKDRAKKFNSLIKGNRWIILYHWKSCGHCIDLLPIWKMAVESEEKNAFIAEIEYDVFPLIQKKYRNVLTFPRICVYENGVLKENFQEKRTLSNLKKFIKTNHVIPDNNLEKTLKNINNIDVKNVKNVKKIKKIKK